MSFIKFLPAICWFIISLVLLCLPGSVIPKYPWLALIHADKWIHTGMFGMLCFLFALPIYTGSFTTERKKNILLLITLSGIAYGIIMEFVQKYWVPNRSFEIWDIAADSTGCLLVWLWGRKRC